MNILRSLFASNKTDNTVQNNTIANTDFEGAIIKVSLSDEVIVPAHLIQEGITVASAVEQFSDDLEIDFAKVTSYKVNGTRVDSNTLLKNGDTVRAYLTLGEKG
jgi:hypothetical protein